MKKILKQPLTPVGRRVCPSFMAKNINRRKFIQSGAGLLAAASFFPLNYFGSGARRNPSSEALNVLFITADDLGWKDLSCDGNTNVKTPHLDALASQGLRFDRAFGVSSSCSSSRASFITGQYISTHGVDGLSHRHITKQLPPFTVTMPRIFQQAGYHTAIQGKWHVSPFFPTGLYGYGEALGTILPWKKHIKNTKLIEQYFQARSKDAKPFYLELNFTDTHRNASGKFQNDPEFPVDPNSIRLPDWMGLPDWPEIRADVALYYSGLLRMDHLVGRTLELLQKYGLEQNTVVVFVSDNGSPFPGNKMTLYDRGIGTPLMIRLPEKIAAGRVSNAMVSTIDIMPTLLDLCKISTDKKIEGKSFASLLSEGSADQHRQHICAEMNYHVHPIPMRAIRTDRWKAIYNLSEAPIGLDDLEKEDWALRLCERADQPWLRPRVPFELYDLSVDPHETRNLAGTPEVAAIEAEFKLKLGTEWKKSLSPSDI